MVLSYIPPYILEEKIKRFMQQRDMRVYDITRILGNEEDRDLWIYRVRTIAGEYGLYWYKVILCSACEKIVGLYDEERGEWIWGRNCPHFYYTYEDGKERLRKRTVCPVCGRPL